MLSIPSTRSRTKYLPLEAAVIGWIGKVNVSVVVKCWVAMISCAPKSRLARCPGRTFGTALRVSVKFPAAAAGFFGSTDLIVGEREKANSLVSLLGLLVSLERETSSATV